MGPLSCICPRCGTTLRVKDKTYLNRPIPCPACRTLLVLALTEAEQLSATIPQSSEPSTAVARTGSHTRPVDFSPPGSLSRNSSSVILVSRAAALLVAGMIGLLVWRSNQPRTLSPAPLETVAATAPSEVSPAIADKTEFSLELPAVESLLPDQNHTEPIRPAIPAETEIQSPPADAMTVVKTAPQESQALPVAAVPVEPKPVDFERALAQPLTAFRQSKAIARLELLELLEELLGAPIRYDADDLGNAAKSLDEKIAFELQNITVGDVLAKVLDETGIVYDQERDGLRLRPAAGDR